MSLINPAILYGLGLAVIPVILHFLLRTKPKKLLFPALRLLQTRRTMNVRRLRLRHIWLLLLRIAIIGLLVLAIARPSLPAADYTPNRNELLTLAAIVGAAVFAYWGMLAYWRRTRLPNHVVTYRRSMLRGGTILTAIILALLLFAWPYQRRISAEISGPLPDIARHLPIAGVLLFDTSTSMEYRYENRTRLEVAQQVAGSYLETLASGSRIAVADTAGDAPVLFQADLIGAQSRIRAQKPSPVSYPLNERILAAIRLQEDDLKRTIALQDSVPENARTDRYLREIYVFTDRARSAWQIGQSKQLREEFARLPWLSVYIIDVGVEKPMNASIPALELSSETVSIGGQVRVKVTVATRGMEQAERVVELSLENEQGQPVKQGEKSLAVAGEAGAQAEFVLPGLTGTVRRGEARLVSSDPLTADDVRYFTIAVRQPRRVLVVSDRRDEAAAWMEAIAPSELQRSGRAPYEIEWMSATNLADADLAKFAAISLINVRTPSEDVWRKLARYVEEGGGLAVLLGMSNNDEPLPSVYYDVAPAQEILPARLLASLDFRPAAYLDVRNLSHPLLRKFDDYNAGELRGAQIARYWQVEPNAGTSVIARFTDRKESPALLERAHGRGRTVMFTTAASLGSWNDLPLGWSFVVLANEMMHYLTRASAQQYNYTAGDDAVVELNPDLKLQRYLLAKPGLEQVPGTVPQNATTLIIERPDQVGHYEVIAAADQPAFNAGFSVNLPASESDLTPLETSDFDEFFGENRYRVAKDLENLERVISDRRLGQEMFSYVLLFVIAVFVAEHFVSNHFYDAEQAPEHRASPA